VSAESLAGSSDQLNTTSNDGCPILNPYDGSLYMASNRPGGYGGLDIWIAPRSGDGWGAPVNAGPNINTAADEFCPTPARGNRFFFVRRLSATDTDIFVVKDLPNKGFGTPQRLPTGDDAINSPWEEWSPSWFEAGGNEYLYFSSTRRGHPTQEIFYSVNLGNAQLATGGVDSSASDARPNVRHDGLEIVWDSTRTGSLGGPDIWTATRSSVDEPWDTAVHLQNGISSAGNDTRASLSWDGSRLMFGTTRAGVEGSADIWTATRE
jgi:Tol biopolymer transport system component